MENQSLTVRRTHSNKHTRTHAHTRVSVGQTSTARVQRIFMDLWSRTMRNESNERAGRTQFFFRTENLVIFCADIEQSHTHITLIVPPSIKCAFCSTLLVHSWNWRRTDTWCNWIAWKIYFSENWFIAVIRVRLLKANKKSAQQCCGGAPINCDPNMRHRWDHRDSISRNCDVQIDREAFSTADVPNSELIYIWFNYYQ